MCSALALVVLLCAEARGLREGPNLTSLVLALESLADRPTIDGSVSLELLDVNAAELGLLCKTLAACGPAVGKVRLERTQFALNLKPFFEALHWQGCTHIYHLR